MKRSTGNYLLLGGMHSSIFNFLTFSPRIYLCGISGFLEQGLLVRDIPRIRKLYMTSMQFKLDLISILPLDLIASIAFLRPLPYLRFNRMIRYPRMSDFVERTETRFAFQFLLFSSKDFILRSFSTDNEVRNAMLSPLNGAQ